MIRSMQHRPATPDKDAIAAMPPFARLGMDRISLVATGPQAREAFTLLAVSYTHLDVYKRQGVGAP